MLAIKVLFFLILVISIVICDDCRIFNLENGTEDLISSYNICNTLAEWNGGEYTSIPSVTPNHEKSTSFIEPSSTASCIATEPFSMTGNGVIEVNVYIESATNQELISAIINSIDEAGQESFVKNDIIFSSLISGWYNWSIEITGTANYNAYVAFVTNDKSEGSIILIDSFRYIPPMISDEDSCNIYNDDEDNVGGEEEEGAEDGNESEEGNATSEGNSENVNETGEDNETEDGEDTEDGNDSGEENETEEDGGTEDGNEPDVEDSEDGEEIEEENENEDGESNESGNESEEENETGGGGDTEGGGESEGDNGTEDGNNNENIDNTEEENGGDGDGNENGEDDATGQDSTEDNTDDNDSDETNSPITVTGVPSFWSPLTISAIVGLGIIIIIVISSTFYQLGKNGAEQKNKNIMLDIDQMPQIRILPRINKLYYNNNMNHQLYM